MGASGKTPRREKGDGFSHSLSAFQLHARSVAFLHYTRRAFERLRWRGFIAAKWHIDEDEAMIAPPHQGSTMIAHHVQCNRHGGGQDIRSEERRVGKEWVGRCRYRWRPS